jgi:pimeloyl-ACP methyl ester carboxylesterase
MTSDTEIHTEIALPAGTIRLRDSGQGEPLFFVHGTLVHGGLWDKVVAELEGDFRCIVPDLPLGAHRIPMHPGADLRPGALVDMIVQVLDALELDRVTLIGNDSGGALSQMFAVRHPGRLSRLVLTNCDAFDNFPPKLFAYMRWAGLAPGAVSLMAQVLRAKGVRSLPFTFGAVAKKPLDPALMESFLRPLIDSAGIRRDAKKLIRGVSPRYTIEAAERLGDFESPTLLVWAPEDKHFPVDHARRLAEIIPNARLETVDDSFTYIPQDQPTQLAHYMKDFLSE